MPERGSAQQVLRAIEEQYWRPIEAVTSLESVLADDRFLVDPGRHVALFSDHGVVHVRDVAARAAELAVRLNGVLLPTRPPDRVAFVAEAAAALAYLHDVGMTPLNSWGRPVHAQYAANVPFTDEFGPILEQWWAEGALEMRRRIEDVDTALGFSVPPIMVFREVLSTTVAHSKSTVPAGVLGRKDEFGSLLRRTVTTPLSEHAGVAPLDAEIPTPAARRYAELGLDADGCAFAWVDDDRPFVREFADDVIDAVRVLRAADALRQRGTTLRTSSGFEICADRETGHGVFALRSVDRRILALFCDPNPFSGAEANVREADLTDVGSLRIAFHRESFGDPSAATRIAEEAAALVADIEADVLGSFASLQRCGVGVVELVRHDRDAPLIDQVAGLARRRPHLEDRIVVTDEAAPERAADLRDWASEGHPFEADPERITAVMDQLARHGMNTGAIRLEAAFTGVREVRIRRGERVFAPHTQATVVLIPMGEGLELVSTGGYGHRVVPAWIPAGVTGVVRGGERNAEVRATADVDVLVLPADLFLTEWFRPYRIDELREASRGWNR